MLTLLRKLDGEDHPNVALTKKALAALYLDQGKHAAAGELLNEALGVLRKSMPEDAWEIADAESLLGGYLVTQGRYEEAEPYLITSDEALRRLRSEHSIYARNARRRLMDLYAAWGKPPPASIPLE